MAEKYTDDPTRTGAKGGAQIYQERKGLPLWLWPLLALLLLGLLYALLHHGPKTAQVQTPATTNTVPAISSVPATGTAPASVGGTPTATATTTNGQPVPPGPPSAAASVKDIKVHSGTDIATAKPAQATAPGVPLSNVVLFAAATDPATFVGRRAKLTNVAVQKVISDRAFFVGPTPQQQVLVLLDKGMDAGASSNAKVTVASGQPISLIGVVEPMPTQEAVNQTYGVSGADYAAIQSQKAYLHATVAQQK